jgi:tRNA nucleotidyltransferase (CCA-adding enzyme)
VVVASGAHELARDLATLLAGGGAELCSGGHERFGTAFVRWPEGQINIATRRAESYAEPGALPQVRPGDIEEDLLRRDFTVNAISVALSGAEAGALRAPATALADLEAHELRILHARSFIDDPTRLLRLARYRARLAFEVELQTASLAAQALDERALKTVSGARIGAELRLALGESDAVESLSSLCSLGVLAALQPPLEFDEQLARDALALLPTPDGRADLLLLAILLLAENDDWSEQRALDAWEFPAPDRDRAISASRRAPALVGALQAAGSRAQERQALRGAPPEALALAGALAARDGARRAATAARVWLEELRHVRLAVTGDDLLAAGVAPGPEIGRRLARLLDMRLEGTLDDSREAQLAAALEEYP